MQDLSSSDKRNTPKYDHLPTENHLLIVFPLIYVEFPPVGIHKKP